MPSRCCVVIEWESSEARRTECRYMAVDPDNRLITSSLEADWEKRSASWKRQRPILKRWSQGLRRVLPRRMSGEWQSIVPQQSATQPHYRISRYSFAQVLVGILQSSLRIPCPGTNTYPGP